MAYRRIGLYVQDEAGNVVGGAGYTVKVYIANTRTLASLFLDSAGADSRPNSAAPNSGNQTTLLTQALPADASVNVASTSGILAGDVLPVNGGGHRTYVVVKTVTDATHLALEGTVNSFAGDGVTYPVGSTVNGPEQIGHLQCFVQDNNDYDVTVTNVGTGVEGDPQAWATLQTVATIAFQKNDSAVGTRGTLDVRQMFDVVDDGGGNRVRLEFQDYIADADGATVTMDFNLGAKHKVTFAGNRTIAFSNPKACGVYTVRITQDGTGGRTATWPAAVRWSGGAAPTLTATGGKTDYFQFYYDGTNYDAVGVNQNF